MFGEIVQTHRQHRQKLRSLSLISQEDSMQGEIMEIHVMETKPIDFLGDIGASHHIVHKLEHFSEIFPLPGFF